MADDNSGEFEDEHPLLRRIDASDSEHSSDEGASNQDETTKAQDWLDNTDPRLFFAQPGECLVPDVPETSTADEDMILKYRRYIEKRYGTTGKSRHYDADCPDPAAEAIWERRRGFLGLATALFSHYPSEAAVHLTKYRARIIHVYDALFQNEDILCDELQKLYHAKVPDKNSIAVLKVVLQMYRTFLHDCLPQVDALAKDFIARTHVSYHPFEDMLPADGVLVQDFVWKKIEAYNKGLETAGVTTGLPQIPTFDEDDLADLIRKCPSVGLREGSAWLHVFLGGRFLCGYRGWRTKESRGPFSLRSAVGKIPLYKLGWDSDVNVYGTGLSSQNVFALEDTRFGSELPLYFPDKLMPFMALLGSRILRHKYPNVLLISLTGMPLQYLKPLLPTLERLNFLPACVWDSAPLTTTPIITLSEMPSSSSTEPEQSSTQQRIVKAFDELLEHVKTNQESTQSIRAIDAGKFGELVQELKDRESLKVVTVAHREWSRSAAPTVKSYLDKLINLAKDDPKHKSIREVFTRACDAQFTKGGDDENKHAALFKLLVSLAKAGRFHPSEAVGNSFPRPLTVSDGISLLPDAIVFPHIIDNYIFARQRGRDDFLLLAPTLLETLSADPEDKMVQDLIGYACRPLTAVPNTVFVRTHDANGVLFLDVYKFGRTRYDVLICAARPEGLICKPLWMSWKASAKSRWRKCSGLTLTNTPGGRRARNLMKRHIPRCRK
jgi:hypothetical protein